MARLSLREKIAYGCGDFASVLYWQTFMVYLTFFYTDVFGLGAAAVGAMLGLSRSLDAFVDPVMGMVADRTQSRWGKFRPYLLWLCVPFAVSGVLTFTVPGFSPSGKLAWAWVTYNAMMVLYTAINIPYTALLGVITPDAQERTSLASVKFVCAFAAGVVISATLLPVAARLGWAASFVVVGGLAVGFFLVTFFGTKERVAPPASQRSSVSRDLRDLLGNGPWLVLLLATLTSILFVAVRGSVTVHYFKYFVGPQRGYSFETLVSAYATSGQLASLLGVVALPPIAARFGRKPTFVAAFLVAIACTAAYYWLEPDQLAAIFALNVVGSFTGGPLSALLWTMYADTADYSEWKNGRRATGLVFSASAFSQKQGWALGAWAALAAMQRVGFVANAEQTAGSRHGLVLLMSVVPAAFGLVAVLVLLAYPLGEAKMAEVAAGLQERRGRDGASRLAG